jgi:hypothetical protein
VQGASDATDAWGRRRRTHLPVRVRKVAEAWSATVPLPRTFLEGAGLRGVVASWAGHARIGFARTRFPSRLYTGQITRHHTHAYLMLPAVADG